MIPFWLYIKEYFWSYDQKYYKFSHYFLIFQQLKFQISQIDQNRVNPFCDETLHMFPWWRWMQVRVCGYTMYSFLREWFSAIYTLVSLLPLKRPPWVSSLTSSCRIRLVFFGKKRIESRKGQKGLHSLDRISQCSMMIHRRESAQ